jgi:hypothetical protein
VKKLLANVWIANCIALTQLAYGFGGGANRYVCVALKMHWSSSGLRSSFKAPPECKIANKLLISTPLIFSPLDGRKVFCSLINNCSIN